MQPARISSADLNLPFGYKFDPTAGELLRHYLIPKLIGEKLPSNYVVEIDDICKSEPTEFCKKKLEYAKENMWYFFTRDPKKKSGNSERRMTPTGYWEVYKDGIPVEDIGLKTKLRFCGLYGNKTDWRMFEYRCHPTRLTSSNMHSCIICKIKLVMKKDEEILVEDASEGD